MTVAETLAQLVCLDSVSSHSNAEIISCLAARCEARGFAVKRLPYIDELGVEKSNLLALAGADFSGRPEVELVLVGHTDTVPYDPAWTDALRLAEREGKL
jgi:acetylornithine deacetylase